MSGEVKIRVEDLVRLFGPVRAVDGVSFKVHEGEIVGFLGPNGAGKTTTMRILTGFLRPTSGRASVAGFDVVEESLEARKRIGYLPENVPLYGEMRVEEYLLYRAQLKGVPRRIRRARVDYVIDRCRLNEMRYRLCGTLSKGYRQRVGLADALVHDPEILILDEPTVGLDPIQVRETRQLIKELGRDRTVLLSTHILSEVEVICQRVIVISYGKIVLNEPLDRLQETRVLEVGVEPNGVPVGEVVQAFRSVDGVAEVQPPNEPGGFYLLTLNGQQDPRAELARLVVQRGWNLFHLAMARRPLEERFIDAVAGDVA